MDYYIKPAEGEDATFVFHDKKHHVLARVSGRSSSIGTAGYPSFNVITANGATEVIEHKKMEPIFYITDDPAVLKALMVQPRRENQVPSSK